MHNFIDFRHVYTCDAPAYETLVIEQTWVQSFSCPSVFSFKSHNISSTFFKILSQKILLVSFYFGIKYDQRVSGFILCKETKTNFF